MNRVVYQYYTLKMRKRKGGNLQISSTMVFFPLYFIMDSGYTNEVSVYKLYLLGVDLSDRSQPLRHGFAVPPPLPRGGLGIPESLASSPEAPLQGELSPKVTERLYEGQPAHEPQPCRKGTALFNFSMSLPRIQAETVKTQKNRFPSCQTGQNALFYSHSLTV